MRINIKHLVFSPLILSIVFLILFQLLKEQSGGDLAIRLFSILFLIVLTLSIGVYSMSWKFYEKIGFIFGLLLAYLLEYILLSVTLP